MENIPDLIRGKLNSQSLTLYPGENSTSDFIIEDLEGNKLHVFIVEPTTYYPDLRKAPYRIETACSFHIPDPNVSLVPNLIVLGYHNEISGRTDFLMMDSSDFPAKIVNKRRARATDGSFEMTIYALEGNLIYDCTDISAEGMWYYVGGRMGDTIGMDITCHLNRWDKIFDFLNLKND